MTIPSGFWIVTAHNFTGFPEDKIPRWARNRNEGRYTTELIQKYYNGHIQHYSVDVLTDRVDAINKASDLIPFCQMVSIKWSSNYKLIGILTKTKGWIWKPE